MIGYEDAVSAARALLGTPYKDLDCINLVKKVIRTALGGVGKYTTAGTNSLWKSFGMAEKYRDITWRQEGISGAQGGMLAFKRSGSDVHHVGLVTREGTVIHSSSALGCVVETPLTQEEGWNLLAVHWYIAPVKAQREEAAAEGSMQCAQVTIIDSAQNTFCPVGDFRVILGSLD